MRVGIQRDRQIKWQSSARYIMRKETASFAVGARQRQRPVGVDILAALMLLAGVLFVIAGAAFFFLGSRIFGASGVPTGRAAAIWAGVGAAAGVIFLGFGALHATLAIGLLQLRNVARILSIFLFSLNAAGACLGLFAMSVRFSPVVLAWNVSLIAGDACAVWYLLRPQIKEAFGA